MSRCRFCSTRESGYEKWLATEDCVAEVVACGGVLWGKSWDLIGGEGIKGSCGGGVVVDHNEECGVYSGEGGR